MKRYRVTYGSENANETKVDFDSQIEAENYVKYFAADLHWSIFKNVDGQSILVKRSDPVYDTREEYDSYLAGEYADPDYGDMDWDEDDYYDDEDFYEED
jgi:hypothetical protein